VLEKQNAFHIFLKYTETKRWITASSGHQVAINDEEAYKKIAECNKIPETRHLEKYLNEARYKWQKQIRQTTL
jgi:hypothetical protein